MQALNLLFSYVLAFGAKISGTHTAGNGEKLPFPAWAHLVDPSTGKTLCGRSTGADAAPSFSTGAALSVVTEDPYAGHYGVDVQTEDGRTLRVHCAACAKSLRRRIAAAAKASDNPDAVVLPVVREERPQVGFGLLLRDPTQVDGLRAFGAPRGAELKRARALEPVDVDAAALVLSNTAATLSDVRGAFRSSVLRLANGALVVRYGRTFAAYGATGSEPSTVKTFEPAPGLLSGDAEFALYEFALDFARKASETVAATDTPEAATEAPTAPVEASPAVSALLAGETVALGDKFATFDAGRLAIYDARKDGAPRKRPSVVSRVEAANLAQALEAFGC